MKIITVKFDGSPVNYNLEYEGEDLKRGQLLLVETSRGLEIVKAISPTAETKNTEKEPSFKESLDSSEEEKMNFIRVTTAKDLEANEANKSFVETIRKETKKLIKKYELEMKISEVRVTLDRSKVTIYFTAENRVDFRELVKELAGTFKTRIELRQIGARDETRLMGGLGACGKMCCCKEFLNEFGHVSIKMAKNQNLSLNPAKINGLCGRLKCCLDYENEYYSEMAKIMPRINSKVATPDGEGIALFNDILAQTVQVKIGDENSFEIKTYNLSAVKQREN